MSPLSFLAVLAIAYALLCWAAYKDEHFGPALTRTWENITRTDKKHTPLIIYTFNKPGGIIQHSKNERFAVRFYAYMLFGIFPILFQITLVNMGASSPHAPVMFLGVFFFFADIIVMKRFVGAFNATVARQFDWEGELRQEKVYDPKRGWHWVERGTSPQQKHLARANSPVPQQPAKTGYTRVFNPATGTYEFSQVLRDGDPNIKPDLPRPEPKGTHGTSEFLSDDDLKQMGAFHDVNG